MVRVVKIPWVREIKIPCVSGSIYRGQGVKIPWLGRKNTMGKWIFIPWIGGRYAMGRGSVFHG